MADTWKDWKRLFKDLQDGVQVIDDWLNHNEPVCPICGGTGYVRYEVALDDPRFGKMFHCPEPDCPAALRNHQQQTEAVMQRSSWAEAYGTLTFDSFRDLMDEMGNWQGKRGAFAAALAFATFNRQDFTLQEAAQAAFGIDWPGDDGRSASSVVLTGGVGLGKTGLAVAATNLLIVQSRPVIFIRMLDLISHIQETYKPGWDDESTEDRLRRFIVVPYLVLDEFGIKSYTGNRLEIVENIIRGRDRAGLPTLITTNLTLEQIYELWEPQIADIVAKAHWVPVAGLKLRQTARKEASTW